MPTWGTWGLNSWGLGGFANSFYTASYMNPFYDPALFGSTTTIINNTTTTGVNPAPVAFDYSQPIDPTTQATAPDDEMKVAVETFETARKAFGLGSYEEALQLANKTLELLPNDPTLHEFRALSLFALKRYEEAAATLYPVLSAGPGWDWTTMVGLYQDSEVYTAQQRQLETYCKENTDSAGARFVLAYHYMVQGHKEAAGKMFQKVADLRPKDQLSAQLAKALAPATEAATSGAAATNVAAADGAEGQQTPPAQPEPDARLTGSWTANVPGDTTINLAIQDDGAYKWTVKQQDQEQAIEGKSGVDQDGVLVLLQEQGPPLAGKIDFASTDQFTFQPLGGATRPRSPSRASAMRERSIRCKL